MLLSEKLTLLIAEPGCGDAQRLTLIRDGLAQIVEYSSDIAEATLDRAYKVA
jgi:hypothetical protein